MSDQYHCNLTFLGRSGGGVSTRFMSSSFPGTPEVTGTWFMGLGRDVVFTFKNLIQICSVKKLLQKPQIHYSNLFPVSTLTIATFSQSAHSIQQPSTSQHTHNSNLLLVSTLTTATFSQSAHSRQQPSPSQQTHYNDLLPASTLTTATFSQPAHSLQQPSPSQHSLQRPSPSHPIYYNDLLPASTHTATT